MTEPEYMTFETMSGEDSEIRALRICHTALDQYPQVVQIRILKYLLARAKNE